MPLQKLDDNRFASSDLYGVLANVCADLDASAMQSTSEFKKIVGGDPIHAERKHREAFTFTPYARLLFSTNEPPPTHDVSQAFFDRWIVLPFRKRFRGTAAEDKNLIRKLSTPKELSGLLNRALDGLERLRRNGGFTTARRPSGQGGVPHRGRQRRRIPGRVASTSSPRADEAGRPVQRLLRLVRGEQPRSLGAQRFHSRVREIASTSPALREDSLDEITVQGRPTYLGIRQKDEP